MSTSPCAWNHVSVAATSDRSSRWTLARAPAASTSRAVSTSPASLTSTSATSAAPRAASLTAVARPIPPADPEIGRAPDGTSLINALLVCRLLLENKKYRYRTLYVHYIHKK